MGTRDVQQMLRGLAGHRTPTGRLMAPATIARILATLRTALAAAVREGLIVVNPAAAARAPRSTGCHVVVWTSKREQAWRAGGQRPPVAVWDTHHLVAFLRGCRDDRFFALWWLAALCGLRRGELCGLTWSTVDLDEQTLTVAEQVVCVDGMIHVGPPKSLASRRTIALDDATVAVLRHHRRLQRAEAEGWTADSRGHVFTLPDGRPVLPSVASHTFTRRVRALRLPPVRLHDLRHGAASLNFAAHDDLKAVQALLGHSSGHHGQDLHQRVARARSPACSSHRPDAADRRSRQARLRKLASLTTFPVSGVGVSHVDARHGPLAQLSVVEAVRKSGTTPGTHDNVVFA